MFFAPLNLRTFGSILPYIYTKCKCFLCFSKESYFIYAHPVRLEIADLDEGDKTDASFCSFLCGKTAIFSANISYTRFKRLPNRFLFGIMVKIKIIALPPGNSAVALLLTS